MMMEVQMITDVNADQPGSDLHKAGEQNASTLLITVKEAAMRLGVSRSTVYRADREHGPLRFFMDGRWISIDLASLESFQARIKRNPGSDKLQRVEGVWPGQRTEDESVSQFMGDALGIEPSETTLPSPPISESRSGGQRELNMREHHAVCFLSCLSFME
jgi:excisionase family DNA binding protein